MRGRIRDARGHRYGGHQPARSEDRHLNDLDKALIAVGIVAAIAATMGVAGSAAGGVAAGAGAGTGGGAAGAGLGMAADVAPAAAAGAGAGTGAGAGAAGAEFGLGGATMGAANASSTADAAMGGTVANAGAGSTVPPPAGFSFAPKSALEAMQMGQMLGSIFPKGPQPPAVSPPTGSSGRGTPFTPSQTSQYVIQTPPNPMLTGSSGSPTGAGNMDPRMIALLLRRLQTGG